MYRSYRVNNRGTLLVVLACLAGSFVFFLTQIRSMPLQVHRDVPRAGESRRRVAIQLGGCRDGSG